MSEMERCHVIENVSALRPSETRSLKLRTSFDQLALNAALHHHFLRNSESSHFVRAGSLTRQAEPDTGVRSHRLGHGVVHSASRFYCRAQSHGPPGETLTQKALGTPAGDTPDGEETTQG
ncbi:hypothetical protein MTO96_013033 [Rhipicephalus appendiculatus]